MNDLIPITESEIGGEPKPTVNARELHAFLGIGKDFTNWIKAQIERARLKEGRDFLTVAQKGDAIIKDLDGLRPGHRPWSTRVLGNANQGLGSQRSGCES